MKILIALALIIHTFGNTDSAQPDHKQFSAMLKKYVVNGAVDYRAFGADKRLDEYLALLTKTTPASIKSTNDRLAFWINAYNAFTIKLITKNPAVKSIRDIRQGDTGPWDIVWIDVGGKKYSLNHIEHEIIRKEFDEPRIHMALVCAAVSCPPLRSEAYTGSKLDAQLAANSKAFAQDPAKNRFDKTTKTLYMSELMKWYGDDFVKRYGSPEEFILQSMELNGVAPTALQYLPYDWSLNTKQ